MKVTPTAQLKPTLNEVTITMSAREAHYIVKHGASSATLGQLIGLLKTVMDNHAEVFP